MINLKKKPQAKQKVKIQKNTAAVTRKDITTFILNNNQIN